MTACDIVSGSAGRRWLPTIRMPTPASVISLDGPPDAVALADALAKGDLTELATTSITPIDIRPLADEASEGSMPPT